MPYKQIRDLEPEEFKRFTGVSRSNFAKMVTVLAEHERSKKKRGRPAKLSLPDQLLVALQYRREYRPYFHIAVAWGVTESAVCRIVHKVEDVLIKAGAFHLPGKKKLREEGRSLKSLSLTGRKVQ
jgi:Helix-turn-helix of DDE superfamily endonuclease